MLTIWKETSFQGISPWGQQLGWLPALPVRRVLVMLLRAGTPWSTPSDFRRSMEKCLHMVTRVIFFFKCLYMSLENLSFFSDFCLYMCWKCVQTVFIFLPNMKYLWQVTCWRKWKKLVASTLTARISLDSSRVFWLRTDECSLCTFVLIYPVADLLPVWFELDVNGYRFFRVAKQDDSFFWHICLDHISVLNRGAYSQRIQYI